MPLSHLASWTWVKTLPAVEGLHKMIKVDSRQQRLCLLLNSYLAQTRKITKTSTSSLASCWLINRISPDDLFVECLVQRETFLAWKHRHTAHRQAWLRQVIEFVWFLCYSSEIIFLLGAMPELERKHNCCCLELMSTVLCKPSKNGRIWPKSLTLIVSAAWVPSGHSISILPLIGSPYPPDASQELTWVVLPEVCNWHASWCFIMHCSWWLSVITMKLCIYLISLFGDPLPNIFLGPVVLIEAGSNTHLGLIMLKWHKGNL